MQVSYFETGRYYAPSNLPRQWPMPAGAYDREAGLRAFRGMVERSRYVEELGFDWVSVSEHHYSPRILTPSLPIAAAYIASHVHNIKIALLGPIVPQSNPVLLAEEMAMLDTMAEGRLIVGMLRGTTNEMLTYDLNPEESRERTDEGMELILRAWKEPEPFGWQGRHFHYRTVSVWPKPLQQPLPPMYALGTSREASDFAARNHIGLGVSFGPFDAMGKVTGYYKDECARYGWQPEPHQIIYRANILIAETGEKAQQALAQYPREAVFPLKAGVAATLLEVDQRNVAGEGRRPANVNRALPINFCGGPDEIVAQLKAGPRTDRLRRRRSVVPDPGLGRSRRADGSARTVRQEGAAAHPRHLKIKGGGNGSRVPRGFRRGGRVSHPVYGGGGRAGARFVRSAAGTLRLAGQAFPLPHRVGVAKAAAAAAAADVCPRHQPRGQRLCGAERAANRSAPASSICFSRPRARKISTS